MADEKIIAVVGATGTQGGGVARALLDDPDGGFALRALTRKPDSEPAKALAERGAEVRYADIDDPESLVKALEGCYGAFFVTNFWEHFSPDREETQIRNMARAARDAAVQHVIWSTLEDTRERIPLEDDRMPTLHGKYKVPHYDTKGGSDHVFQDLGVPTTFLRTSFYWDNMVFFGMEPQRGEDGVLAITLPMADKKLPGIAAADIGPTAYAIFKRGKEMIGRTVGIAGGHLTIAEMAAGLTDALGEEVRYNEVSPEVYRSFGFPGADDLGNMFQYKADFEAEYCGARPLERTRELNPSVQTYQQWLEENAARIPVK